MSARRNAPFTDEQKRGIVELYEKGVETQYIISAYGCHPNTMLKIVKAAGVPLRPSWREKKREKRVSG